MKLRPIAPADSVWRCAITPVPRSPRGTRRLHSHQLDLRRPLWALQRLAVHMGEALDELGAYVAAAA